MPIQLITDKFGRPAYQARFGPYKATRSKYFSFARYGCEEAERLANEALSQFAATMPPVRRGSKPNPLVGMRAFHEVGSTGQPILHIGAWWRDAAGRQRGTQRSAEKHGVMEAVAQVMARRELATGHIYGLTARQAWNTLRRALEIEPRT